MAEPSSALFHTYTVSESFQAGYFSSLGWLNACVEVISRQPVQTLHELTMSPLYCCSDDEVLRLEMWSAVLNHRLSRDVDLQHGHQRMYYNVGDRSQCQEDVPGVQYVLHTYIVLYPYFPMFVPLDAQRSVMMHFLLSLWTSHFQPQMKTANPLCLVSESSSTFTFHESQYVQLIVSKTTRSIGQGPLQMKAIYECNTPDIQVTGFMSHFHAKDTLADTQ